MAQLANYSGQSTARATLAILSMKAGRGRSRRLHSGVIIRLAQCAQVSGEAVRRAQGVGVVLAEHPGRATVRGPYLFVPAPPLQARAIVVQLPPT
jgi:hypothetical protein